jgi:hypothetical protein
MKMRMNSKTAGIVFLLICLLVVLFIGQFVYLGSFSESMDSVLEGAKSRNETKAPRPYVPGSPTTRAPKNMSLFEGAKSRNETKAPRPYVPGSPTTRVRENMSLFEGAKSQDKTKAPRSQTRMPASRKEQPADSQILRPTRAPK